MPMLTNTVDISTAIDANGKGYMALTKNKTMSIGLEKTWHRDRLEKVLGACGGADQNDRHYPVQSETASRGLISVAFFIGVL